jgi:hypothetical protein
MGVLPFSKLRGRVYVRRADLLQILEENVVHAPGALAEAT